MDKDKKISPEKKEGNKSASAENNKGKKNDNADIVSEITEGEAEAKKKKFYAETWFLVTLAVVAAVSIFAILIMTALGGGLSFKNLFGKSDGDLDYINDSLDKYINIKESDYKGYEITVPVRKPNNNDLQAQIDKLIATHRGGPTEGADTMYTNKPIAIGDDVTLSYLGYQLDADGRKILVSNANNLENANTKVDRYTVGLNSDIFGIGLESALVGKKPNGKIDSVRGEGAVLDGNVIYATVSFVLDNGLVYDEVSVCIDPAAEDFERLWGIDAYEDLFKKCSGMQGIGMMMLTGNAINCFDLEGGGTITYTALTVNYVTTSSVQPITVETYYPADHSVEEIRNKTVYYDLYINNVIKYNVSAFDETFIKEKLNLTEEKLSSYEGEGIVEKCKSYYKTILDNKYNETCKTYLESAIWQRLHSTIRIKTYPAKEIDRIYIAEIEAYTAELIEENEKANGAGYESLDDYMPTALGLEEGAEWTSYLLESVKSTVKERLIIYAILRQEGILPVGEEFDRLYEKELKKDYEHAITQYPGTFSSLEEYREYVYETRGEIDYIHDVYYYYLTEKLIEFVTPVYSES